jgi:hypothetical protein
LIACHLPFASGIGPGIANVSATGTSMRPAAMTGEEVFV